MSRRVVVIVSAIALALAGLQLLGVAMDAAWILRRLFEPGYGLARGAGHLLLAVAETAIAVCWLVVAVALLRGRTVPLKWLVALLVVALTTSTVEWVWHMGTGDLDVTQTLSIGLELVLGALLALPSTRAALGPNQRV